MATEKKELIFKKNGQKRPYFVAGQNVNLGDKENPVFLPDRLAEMERSIEDAKESGYAPPDGGIPQKDLSQSVQDTLDSVANKVDKEQGKGLSSNDYTDADKAKVDSMKAVATSGSYNDLTDKPTIPAGAVVDPALSDTSENAVQNKVVKAAIDRIQAAIDALTGTSDTTAAINTMNEVATFLADVTNNETLVGKLNELRTLINDKQDVISDLSSIRSGAAAGASAVQPGQMQAAIEEAVKNVPTGDIPKNVSELTNDAGYQTQEQVASAISQAAIEAVVGNGDFAMTYDRASDTFNIVRLVPALQVTQLPSMSASTKSGTFKVSGTNLKGNVTIAITATGWTLSDGTNTGQTLTLVPTDGTLAETTITVTYSGSTDSVGNTITVSSTNAEEKTVTANYTVTAGPTIFADTSKTIQAIAGDSATATIAVTASQLTEGITVIKGNDNANKFTVSPTSLGTSGGTLTVQFSPASGDTTNKSATITLHSAGAEDVVIALTGQVLVPSLSVSPASLDFAGEAGTATQAQQIVLTGTNLLNDVTVTAPTGFSVTRNGSAVTSIAKADVMASGVTLDVIAAGTSESGSLMFASGLASASTALSWHETEEDPVEGGYLTKKVGLKDGVSTPIAVDANGNQIEIEFKVKTVATSNTGSPTDTDGEVTVVSKTHEEAYSAALQNGNYSNVKTLVIPEAIIHNDKYYKVIGAAAYAFAYASTSIMTSVTFGNNIKSIGAHFAQNVQKINTLDLGNSVQAIGDQAFNKVPALTNLEIPDSVTSIGNTGISTLSGLRTLIVGTGLAAISYSIEQYTGITSITLKRDGVVGIVEARINEMPSSVNLYVPSSQIANYKAHSVWGAHIYDETDNPSGKLHIQAIPNE